MDASALPGLAADATAEDHLVVQIPVANAGATVRQAREVALQRPNGAHVFVTGDRGELVGLISVPRLFFLDEREPILPHLEPPPPAVHVDEDQERVALVALRHTSSSVPVVDSSGRFLGIVPAAALLRVLHHEHIEDLDRLSGVLRQTEHAARVLEQPTTRRVRERLPWLLVGLAGSAVATWVVASFDAELERRLAVAFFIPGIVYLADAIGTQTEAIAVRGLSFHGGHAATELFAGELRTGLALGAALALPVFPVVWWIFGDARLGAAVAVALLVAGTVATGVGLAFPYALSRAGRDPAFGSGPLATVVQDVLSLLAYFLAVRILMGSS